MKQEIEGAKCGAVEQEIKRRIEAVKGWRRAILDDQIRLEQKKESGRLPPETEADILTKKHEMLEKFIRDMLPAIAPQTAAKAQRDYIKAWERNGEKVGDISKLWGELMDETDSTVRIAVETTQMIFDYLIWVVETAKKTDEAGWVQ